MLFDDGGDGRDKFGQRSAEGNDGCGNDRLRNAADDRSSVAESTKNSAPKTIPAAPKMNLPTLTGTAFF